MTCANYSNVGEHEQLYLGLEQLATTSCPQQQTVQEGVYERRKIPKSGTFQRDDQKRELSLKVCKW